MYNEYSAWNLAVYSSGINLLWHLTVRSLLSLVKGVYEVSMTASQHNSFFNKALLSLCDLEWFLVIIIIIFPLVKTRVGKN